MPNVIRWNRGNETTLKIAISSFNKKINELQRIEKKAYLPETLEFSEVKKQITTESELKRFVKSLRNFKKEGSEDLYVTQAGEEITTWEKRELDKQIKIATNRLQRKLDELNRPDSSGYSRVQMGSVEARTIEAQLKNLANFESKKGYEFKRQKERIKSSGTADYQMRKAITFRENYILEMKKYAHLENYDKLKKKMYSLKNPLDFYDFVSKNELLVDLTYQSDEYYTQEEFNRFVSEDWGILIDEINETVSKGSE